MGFKANTVLFLSAILVLLASSTCQLDATFRLGMETFNHNLFNELVKSHGHENIIYSPLSIQSCLAMARMGADGETAAEMDQVLGFQGQTTESVAHKYHFLLANYQNSNLVHLATKVYVMNDYELQNSYKDLLSQNFFSSAESIDFSKCSQAASTINNWVESKTDHLIKDLITSKMLSSDTRLLLLSAIHFNGKWVNAFTKSSTHEADFYIDLNTSVKVQMMQTQNRFQFGVFYRNGFSAVRLPYQDSDLSMLVIVPRFENSLDNVLEYLKNNKLEKWTNEMSFSDVEVYLPKFKVEFQVELTETLKKLGMEHLFGNADLGKMLQLSEPITGSSIVHKAFIEVSEEGTVASAATAQEFHTRMEKPCLYANRPFVYAIVNAADVILFQGTVVKF